MMEVASRRQVDSLRPQTMQPTMEAAAEFVDSDARRCDCFGPAEGLNVAAVPSAAAPGVHRQPKAFLVGFKDCHQEVLRYLVDVEQVPLAEPVIFGLEKHLTFLESRMQTTSCDCGAEGSCGGTLQTRSNCSAQLRGNKTDDDDEEEEEEEYDSSSFKNYLTTAQDDRLLEEEEEVKESVCDTCSRGGRSGSRTTTDDDASAVHGSFDSGCCDSSGLLLLPVASSSSDDGSVISMDCSYEETPTTSAPPCSDAAAVLPKEPGGGGGDGGGGAKNDSEDTAVTESELAENALELMHLAHNNPCISRILNELFVLMENDYDDDDDDDEDDHNDGGIEMEDNDAITSEFDDDC